VKPIQQDTWPAILLITALIFGAFVRFNPGLSHDFAIRQGGMFSVMVEELRANNYVIPQFTSYNQLDIPYAYPPLGFYLGGVAADLFQLSADQVLRWLPALFASLSVAAFYLLALQLLKNRYRAAVATVFFALAPRAFSWFVTGAGLTRSPAQFFMLLTLTALVSLYEKRDRRQLVWAALFGGLTVLSHPEIALHTGAISFFLWIMLSRSRTGLFHSIAVLAIILLVTAPWWATVISYHGVGPLLNAAQTGHKSSAILNLLFFEFAEEPYLSFIAILGLLGIAYSLIRKNYLLPLWVAIPFLTEGRSAAGPAIIPLTMLAALGWVDVVLQSLVSLSQKIREHPDEKVPRAEINLFVYLILYLVFSAYQYGLQFSSASLRPAEREAMHWVSQNTPENSRFLVLTGTTSVSCDSVLEWFPALAGRQSIFTVQGREWTEGRNFNAYVESTYAVQECLNSADASCLDAAVDRSQYEYVYLSRVLRVNNCIALNLPRMFPQFVEALRTQPGFAVMYETDDVIIYQNR
jgi:hypothetical protein